MSNKQILEYLALGSACLSALLMLVGFFKPWVVLWWEDVQHRKKVVKYYGIAILMFYGLYWVFHLSL